MTPDLLSQNLSANWSRKIDPRLRAFLARYGRMLLLVSILVSIVPLILKYSYETLRLLGFLPGTAGGIDLGFYFRWTHSWFNGINVYIANATPQGYPPASMLLLYPLTGWLDMNGTRWLWMFSTLFAFAVVAYIFIRAVGTKSWLERIGILVLFLLNNGTGVTYGNGQATLFVVALLLLSILILRQQPVTWYRDVLAAAFFIGALVKPNLSLPYAWLLLIFPNTLRLRPLVLIALGYAGLTLWAAQYIPTPLPELLSQFLSGRLGQVALSLDPNIHYLLGTLGLGGLLLPVSAILGLGWGIWIYYHRRADVWLLLAVTTLMMRFWGYHMIYDNLFLIIPGVALVRIIRRDRSAVRREVVALILLALNVLVTLPPGNLGGRSVTIQVLLILAQATVWGATLLFFFLYSKGPVAAHVPFTAPSQVQGLGELP